MEQEMTRTRVTTVIICAVFLGLASCRSPVETISAGVPELDDNFETDTLVIETDDGSHHEFTVYLAIEPEQQRRGLMFVRKMPADRGMLFVYDVSDNHSMWMKNTYLSLDMIFARSDGTVSSVSHDTQPLSLATISSTEPVTYVLELNAGTARRLGISQKSRIIWQPAPD